MGQAVMAPRVCLLTPGHLATNPRLVKEADALAAAGYEVEVVAARFTAWADEADREFDNRPWRVQKIPFGAAAPTAARAYRSLRRKLARRAMGMGAGRLAVAERAFHWIVPELAAAACNVRADLYIAHNLAALPAAYRASRLHGAKLGFDAEDFHAGEMSDGAESDFDRHLVERIEGHYLPACSYLTAASGGIARAYAARYGLLEPTTILNVFPLAQAPSAPTPRGFSTPSPSVYWFSQTIGPDRGLEAAVRALGLSTHRPHLCLRGNVSAAYRSFLQTLANEHAVGAQLHFLQPGAPGEMPRRAAEYDLGLASEPGTTLNNRLACSNKVFTYLLAGVPSLASATPAQCEVAAMAEGAVHLYATDNAGALAKLLDRLLGSPQALAQSRARAWSLGQTRFNWDNEKLLFLTRIARAFGS